MTTPNTDELSSSHIPALATLCALGWRFLAPADCLEQRGGEGGALLRADLIAHLSRHRFDYRGAVHPLSTNSIDFIVRTLSAPPLQDGLLAANQRVYDWLTLGITVTEFVDGKKLSITVPLINWQDVEANRFVVTEELAFTTSDGTRTRRPDIVGFVNGIPMIVIEAKRPVSGGSQRMVEEGISQTIRNQKADEIPQLFAFAQLLFSVSGSDGRYGTTGTPRKFWASWRDEEFDEAHCLAVKNGTAAEDRDSLLTNRVRDVRDGLSRRWSAEMAVNEQDRLLIGLATPARLLEFVRFYMFFDRKVGKIAARHQQMFGIRKLIAEISKVRPADHPKGPGRETIVLNDLLAEMQEDNGPDGFSAQVKQRRRNYRKAVKLLSDLAGAPDLKPRDFLPRYEEQLRYWHSGGLHRGKSSLAKKAPQYQAALRALAAEPSQDAGALFDLLKSFFDKIPRAGTNVLTEILHTRDPKRFPVMNRNSVAGLGLANIRGYPRKPAKSNLDGETYRRFAFDAVTLCKNLGLRDLGELDVLFNFAYWNSPEPDDEDGAPGTAE